MPQASWLAALCCLLTLVNRSMQAALVQAQKMEAITSLAAALPTTLTTANHHCLKSVDHEGAVKWQPGRTDY